MKTQQTERILKYVPKVEKSDDEATSESETESVVELHPEVVEHAPFKFKPGKPDRVKKVLRFFAGEEAKFLKSAQKALIEQSQDIN